MLLSQNLASTQAIGRRAFAVQDYSGSAPITQSKLVASEQEARSFISIAKEPLKGLAERLYDARATAKIWTSKVATKLDPAARRRFFHQIDLLHDLEEWADESQPLNLGSYKTFLRAILSLGISDAPGLALMPDGNLLAIWHKDGARLSIEFEENDWVRWVFATKRGERTHRLAGESDLVELKAELSQDRFEIWWK